MTDAATRGSINEALAGVVERVTFHTPETGFCVLRMKARGQKDLITVVGHAAGDPTATSFRPTAQGYPAGLTVALPFNPLTASV